MKNSTARNVSSSRASSPLDEACARSSDCEAKRSAPAEATIHAENNPFRMRSYAEPIAKARSLSFLTELAAASRAPLRARAREREREREKEGARQRGEGRGEGDRAQSRSRDARNIVDASPFAETEFPELLRTQRASRSRSRDSNSVFSANTREAGSLGGHLRARERELFGRRRTCTIRASRGIFSDSRASWKVARRGEQSDLSSLRVAVKASCFGSIKQGTILAIKYFLFDFHTSNERPAVFEEIHSIAFEAEGSLSILRNVGTLNAMLLNDRTIGRDYET